MCSHIPYISACIVHQYCIRGCLRWHSSNNIGCIEICDLPYSSFIRHIEKRCCLPVGIFANRLQALPDHIHSGWLIILVIPFSVFFFYMLPGIVISDNDIFYIIRYLYNSQPVPVILHIIIRFFL